MVWGQILEDRGYLTGKCDHSFRTVQFKGRAEKILDENEINYAINLLVDQLEENPKEVKERYRGSEVLKRVNIIRIVVEGMSGKKNIS